MVDWEEEALGLINKYKGKDMSAVFNDLPNDLKRYKCPTCRCIVEETPCPSCGYPDPAEMCPLDHCHCPHEIVETLEYCPLCGEPVCPGCGTHDVTQISRVTGYLQEVGGFNAGKKQEVKDRHRWNLGDR